MFAKKFFRRFKQLRLAAAKAIYGLPRIADNKNTRRRIPPMRRMQPAADNLPLHRTRILKFINQNMAVAAVQFELNFHRRRIIFIGQQTPCFSFKVVKFHDATLAFNLFNFGEPSFSRRQSGDIKMPREFNRFFFLRRFNGGKKRFSKPTQSCIFPPPLLIACGDCRR